MASAEAEEKKPLAPIEYRSIFGVRLQIPCDMADDMAQHCIELGKKHLAPIENDWQEKGDEAVSAMKEALDAKYGPAWTVLAGKRWGASITHDQKHFINFVVGKDLNVTIFLKIG